MRQSSKKRQNNNSDGQRSNAPAKRVQKRNLCPRKVYYPRCAGQRGLALLVVLTFLTLGAAFLLLNGLNKANTRIERNQETYALLAQAKTALIDWAIMPRGSALGQLPRPDALDPSENPPRNYDGSMNAGCIFTGWIPGNALIASGAAMRCIGRLPWKSLNLAIPSPSDNDPVGNMPWYAVSSNLVDLCFGNAINPAALNLVYSAFNCAPGQLPYPWLTVRDDKGNVLSNRVAAVIIMPNAPLPGQTHTQAPLSGPAAYLDSVIVATGCTAPCVPGTYNNAGLTNDFIQGKDSAQVAATDPNYAQPYRFNDQLIYITIDELMAAAEKRAAQEARQNLRNFYAVNNYYPYAANTGDAGGNCVNGNTRGFLPRAIGSCAGSDFLTSLPAWFTNNSWQNFIYYTMAPACIPGTINCNRPAPFNTFLTAGTANNLRALLISTGRPIATISGQIPAMTTPPFTVKGSAQTGFPSTLINDYLDSVGNTNGDDIYDAVGTVLGTTYNDQIIIVAP